MQFSIGSAGDREVEDWIVWFHPQLDFGDLPDTGPGTGLGNYQTLLAHEGPRHMIVPGLALMPRVPNPGILPVDGEPDGQPSPEADGDDLDGNQDEESIAVAIVSVIQTSLGGTVQIAVGAAVQNLLAKDAWLTGFLDVDQDGAFDSPGEREVVMVSSGTADDVALLNFGMPLELFGPGLNMRYLRLRLSTEEDLEPTGYAPDGEVEDYQIKISLLTPSIGLGSLPDTTPGTGPGDFQTLLEHGGPSHWSGEIFFGNLPAGSTDLPNLSGIQAPDTVWRGHPAVFTVTATNKFGGLGQVADEQVSFQFAFDPKYIRFGSLPDPTPGVGPEDYQTLVENGGPTHWQTDHLILYEVVPEFPLRRGATARFDVRITNTIDGKFVGFFDWNADGDFDDPGERLDFSPPNGVVDEWILVEVPVPADAVLDSPLGFRFRLANEHIHGPDGHHGHGDIQDLLVTLRAYDFGDLPDTGPGFGPGNYQTLLAHGGPFHQISPLLFMPPAPESDLSPVDEDTDGQPAPLADGDDLDGNNDDSGFSLGAVQAFAILGEEGFYNIFGDLAFSVRVSNLTDQPATLTIWLDKNDNGSFEDFGEARTLAIPAGTDNGVFDFSYTLGAAELRPGSNRKHIRLRLHEASFPVEPNGWGGIGEVSDHVVDFDFEPVGPNISTGSLPDTTPGTGPGDYQTLLQHNGPTHWCAGFTFGNLVCGLAPGPDFEGVLFASPIRRGATTRVSLTVSNFSGANGHAHVFIDWNRDGEFDGPHESFSQPVPHGSIDLVLDFDIPVPLGTDVLAPIGSRFRLSNQADLGPLGHGGVGMVLDFLIEAFYTPAEEALENWLDFHELTGEDRALNGNPDQDERDTLSEYALGRHPNEPSDAGSGLRLESVEAEGLQWMELVFPRRRDAAARGLVYLPGVYESLGDPENNLELLPEQIDELDEDFEDVRLRVNRPLEPWHTLWFGILEIQFTP